VNTSKTFPCLLALLVAAVGTLPAIADNNQPASGSHQIRSVFNLPSSSKDGRDPFYPESTRVMDDLQRANASKTVELTSLKVPGISGTPGHLLAIINNHTFAIGDEGDVLTASGRVHLRCIDIHPDSVLVEINGQMHRINLEAQ
jgi:hypothetical protein